MRSHPTQPAGIVRRADRSTSGHAVNPNQGSGQPDDPTFSQSIQRPRPSIEMRTPAFSNTPVKRGEVNWLPWSVLKISGQPNRAKASSRASMQNSTSMVFDTRRTDNNALAVATLGRGEQPGTWFAMLVTKVWIAGLLCGAALAAPEHPR